MPGCRRKTIPAVRKNAAFLAHSHACKAMQLSLHVVAAASSDEICGWPGDSLKIRVRAAAENGKANAAVVKLLAEILGLHSRAINIDSGTTATRKIVDIESLIETQVPTIFETKNH